jgi:eukaryotic-like serine/threonine-protein kinase
MRYASTSIGDSLIGATLAGRYRIEARVGSGAMGAVYRAHQTGLARRVAVKILNRDRSLSGDTVQRFRREAQAMSALHHPNTVRVFDFGSTDDGLLYLAMELLEGESVTDRLVRQGALGVKEAVLLAQSVLRSIGEAHAHGIVHRDLKPDNVYLARVQGEPLPVVKVLDFGIAKAIEGERKIDQFETLDGTVFGTPRYMSPEQAAGKALDSRSDLYAVGIMLFEFLAGRPPFVDSDAVVVMARHIREPPLPLSAAAPDAAIPPSLQAVVARALAKEPYERWQTADEFDRALADCLPDVERLEKLSRRGWHRSWLARFVLAPRRLLAAGAGAVALALVVFFVPRAFEPPDLRQLPAAVGDEPSPANNPEPSAALTAIEPSSPRAKPATERAARKRVVRIESQPSAAQVFRGGAEVGMTPVEIAVAPGSPVMVLLRKRGYVDHSVELVSEDGRKKVTLLPLPAKASAPARRERRSKPQTGTGTRAEKPESGEAATDSPYEKF